jgi:hypothetical protein
MSSPAGVAYLSAMELEEGMVMNRSKLIASLFVLQLSALGCAGSRPEARPDPNAGLIAMGPSTGTPTTKSAPAAAAMAKVPDEVLHDPAQKFALTERLRTQIVARTRSYSDDRYWKERPILRRQLEDAGLPRADVDFLLAQVDQARRPVAP